MSPAEFRIRCRVAESCLPDAEYRKKLTDLHDELLAVIEQPAPVQQAPVKWSDYEPDGLHHNKPAQRPVKTYHGGKPWPVAPPVVSLQCAHCHVTIETLNDKVMRTLAEVERLKAAQPAAHQCHWIQMDDMHMPDTWQGACGAVWTFTEGGPQDNDQAYCPKCGGVCIEVRAVEEGGAA